MAIRFGADNLKQSKRQIKRKFFRTAELILTSRKFKIYDGIITCRIAATTAETLCPGRRGRPFCLYQIFLSGGELDVVCYRRRAARRRFSFFSVTSSGWKKNGVISPYNNSKEVNYRGLTVERDLYFKQETFSRCLARWKLERGG